MKVIFSLILGLVIGGGIVALYYNNPPSFDKNGVPSWETISFFWLVYPSLQLSGDYINKPYSNGCMGDICDEMGAFFDINYGGIKGVYFGGADMDDMKKQNITFLGIITASGTKVMTGSIENINNYIFDNWSNIKNSTVAISGGRELLEQRKKSNSDYKNLE